MKLSSAAVLRICASLLTAGAASAADVPLPGDFVRVKKGAMLQVEGKNLVLAPKRGEWLVSRLANDSVQIAFVKDDGSLVAASLLLDDVELCEPDGATDLQGALDAFAAFQPAESRRLFTRAAANETTKVLAGALSVRVLGALAASERVQTPAGRQAFVNTLQTLRDSAAQLAQAGRFSLALAMDQGADKLAARVFAGGAGAPPTKLDRADVERRVAISTRAVREARQGLALRRLIAASSAVTTGLEAEPARAELKALAGRMQRDIEEAGDCWAQAEKMKDRGEKGVIHALSSLDDGLRLCADHPKLLALRREMQSAFESRTSPQVDDRFLSIVKGQRSALEEGRRLYTTRCTECHDLEMLDSRGLDGWQRIVGGMSRRAGVDAAGQGKIVAYIEAALQFVAATGGE